MRRAARSKLQTAAAFGSRVASRRPLSTYDGGTRVSGWRHDYWGGDGLERRYKCEPRGLRTPDFMREPGRDYFDLQPHQVASIQKLAEAAGFFRQMNTLVRTSTPGHLPLSLPETHRVPFRKPRPS
jgi:hypothetical protein